QDARALVQGTSRRQGTRRVRARASGGPRPGGAEAGLSPLPGRVKVLQQRDQRAVGPATVLSTRAASATGPLLRTGRTPRARGAREPRARSTRAARGRGRGGARRASVRT